MRYFAGMTEAEIAAVLGITGRTVTRLGKSTTVARGLQ